VVVLALTGCNQEAKKATDIRSADDWKETTTVDAYSTSFELPRGFSLADEDRGDVLSCEYRFRSDPVTPIVNFVVATPKVEDFYQQKSLWQPLTPPEGCVVHEVVQVNANGLPGLPVLFSGHNERVLGDVSFTGYQYEFVSQYILLSMTVMTPYPELDNPLLADLAKLIENLQPRPAPELDFGANGTPMAIMAGPLRSYLNDDLAKQVNEWESGGGAAANAATDRRQHSFDNPPDKVPQVKARNSPTQAELAARADAAKRNFVNQRKNDEEAIEDDWASVPNRLANARGLALKPLLEQLAVADPTNLEDKEIKNEIARGVLALAQKTDNPACRPLAVKALGVWGGKHSVPFLIEILESPAIRTSTAKQAAITLGMLQDERAAEPLVRHFLRAKFGRDEAKQALIAAGPICRCQASDT
jgi:hypothetical protein